MQIFHKTRCITCQKTIAELQRMKQDIKTRDFFTDPFSEAELEKIIQMTGKTPSELLRKRDPMYKELGLDDAAKKSDSQIIKLMVQYPGLILRPIIITADEIFVGKPGIADLLANDL